MGSAFRTDAAPRGDEALAVGPKAGPSAPSSYLDSLLPDGVMKASNALWSDIGSEGQHRRLAGDASVDDRLEGGSGSGEMAGKHGSKAV